MLEQLGLGVVLSMEDDFTPQANTALDSFNRLQSGAENMVANVEKNMLQMRNVMMTGFTFQQMGESLENFGNKINKTFENMYSGAVKAGAHWETLKNTMTTFYREQTDATMQKGLELASRTPFEVEDVMDSLRSLKAMKMDALKVYDELDNAGKKYKKTFLEYIGDLGAFNPEQGMKGAMTAVRNLLGGSKKSIDSRFDVNSEYILGEKWSDDPKKVQEQFVKFIDKLAPNMMKNLEGTFEQLVSNMEDKWTMFKIAVAEGGAFEPMKKTLEYVSEKFDEIYDSGKMKQIAGVVGQALGALWKPVDFLVKRVTDLVIWFGKFSEAHPHIAKVALAILGVVGVTVTLTGVLLKLSGGILMAISSISILVLNFRLMKLTGVSLTSALSGLGGVIAGVVSKLSILGIVGAGAFLAWERNIGGIQTRLKGFFSSITTGWALAKEAMRKGANLDGVMKNYQFKAKINLPPLTKIFAGKFLKILAITKAFWQVFTGHFDNGVMHFSKKDWDLYEKAGIAGLVRGLVYAKDKIDRFFQGFKEGLTVVGGVLEQFVSMIWKPVKIVIDAITSNINKYPNGLMARLFVGKDGVNLGTAEKCAEMAHRLGKALGVVVGSLTAMKVIGWITPKLLSPFTKLYRKLGQIGNKALDVRAKLAGIASGGVGGIATRVISKSKNSKYYSDVGRDIKQHVSKYDRTSNHKRGAGFRDGKFLNLSRNDVDDTYYNYFLKDKLRDGHLQVKRRSKIGKLFLGEDYYRKNSDGSREKLGRFGGLLRMDRDDRNIENRATSLFARRQMPRENTIDGLTHRPKLGDPVGRLKDLKGSEHLLAEQQHKQDIVRSTARQVTGLSNSQFNRFSTVRQRELSKDYQGLSNKAHNKTITNSEMARLRSYNELGFDFKDVKAFDSANFNNPQAKGIYSAIRKQRASNALSNSTQYRQAKMSARATSLNQNVFADTKQNAVSRMLFGQRLYTVNKDQDGQYIRSKVGRRGGVFRRSSSDMTYNTGTLGATIRGAVSNSRIVSGARYANAVVKNSSIGRGAGRVLGVTQRRASSITQGLGRVKSVAGKPFSVVGDWYNKQRQRVGLAPRQPRERGMGVTGIVKGTSRALFGSKIRNAEGQVIGRRRGLVSKVGGGAVRATRGVFRGAGVLGGMAMRAMPLMALGGLAFKGISAKGAGVNRKKLGLDPKASNFQAGLKVFQQSLSKVNFSKMWAKFKKEASGSFKIVKQIAKDVFNGLKPLLPKIMRQAFVGIKGIAKLGWQWIKTDGVVLFGQLANTLMQLSGKAWQWISANAGSVVGKIVQFVVGTAIPKLIAGVIKLGAFIITHIPQILRGLMGIALGIFRGIFNGVKQIFSGIAHFLWNAFKSALSGLGSVILGAIATPIRAIPVVGNKVADFLHLPAHHGGLWMSQDEHMAVIKKDETVLPPDKSRQLNDILQSGKGSRGGNSGVVRGNSHIDNSITIKEVKVNVQAEKLSRSDARKQALMIIDELKKIKREKQVRNHEDILSTGINL